MPKYKIYWLALLYLLWFALDWWFSNQPHLKSIETGLFTEEDIFLSLLDPSNGYNGVRTLFLIYVLLLLFGVYYSSVKHETAYMIRFSSRDAYRKREIKRVAAVIAVFTFSHSIINLVLIYTFIDWGIIQKFDFAWYNVLAFTAFFLFYLQIAILYFIFRDYTHKNLISILLVQILCFVMYFAYRFLPFLFWHPAYDLMMGFGFIISEESLVQLPLLTLRGLIIAFLLLMVHKRVFERKDIFQNEKQ